MGMESGILPQTGAISRRFLAVVALLLSQLTLAAPAPLFDDDSVIEEKVWLVKSTIQSMVNRGLRERKGVFL